MSRPPLVSTPPSASRTPEPFDGAGRGRRRIDVVAVNAAMHRLVEDPDPAVVFGHLADLCVPAVCDGVMVELLNRAGPSGVPVGIAHAIGSTGRAVHQDPTRAATIEIASDAGRLGGTHPVDYVVRLTCTWREYRPTPADVALIELLGRCAAGTVRQARQEHPSAPTDKD